MFPEIFDWYILYFIIRDLNRMRESYLHRTSNMKLGSAFVVLYLCQLTDPVFSSNDAESKILSRYKPLSLDESLTLVKSPNPRMDSSEPKVQDDFISRKAMLDGIDPRFDSWEPLNDLSEPLPLVPKTIRGPRGNELNSGLADIRNSDKLNISETLFALPSIDEDAPPELGKLITGKKKPTFAMEKVAKSKIDIDSNGKIIASYKLIIPILIPAVVKKVSSSTTKPVQFREEVHTKMVPMKVPGAKTVFRAERRPQKMVTDYVKVDSRGVPSEVDDKLKPDDEVVGRVVENYD